MMYCGLNGFSCMCSEENETNHAPVFLVLCCHVTLLSSVKHKVKENKNIFEFISHQPLSLSLAPSNSVLFFLIKIFCVIKQFVWYHFPFYFLEANLPSSSEQGITEGPGVSGVPSG